MKVLRTAAVVVGAVATIATFGAALGPTLGLTAAAASTISTIAVVGGLAYAAPRGAILRENTRSLSRLRRWLKWARLGLQASS